jgi:hypothetical protein
MKRLSTLICGFTIGVHTQGLLQHLSTGETNWALFNVFSILLMLALEFTPRKQAQEAK